MWQLGQAAETMSTSSDISWAQETQWVQHATGLVDFTEATIVARALTGVRHLDTPPGQIRHSGRQARRQRQQSGQSPLKLTGA